MIVSKYDEEPVIYCEECLSLENPEIQEIDGIKIEVCKYCGCSRFSKTDIFDWENKFEEKYKQGKFLNIQKKWKEIIKTKSRR